MSTTESMVKVQPVTSMLCSLLILKPSVRFKDWISELCARETSLSAHANLLSLDDISQDSMVFCLPQFLEADKYEKYLKKNYRKLLDLTFSSWCSVVVWWPQIDSYADFLAYFTPEFHSQVYDAFSSTDLSAVSDSLENTGIAASSSQAISKMNCMIILLRPLREFWVWIKKIEHTLPDEVQAVFKTGGHLGDLDANCNAYCIPEFAEEADVEKFMLLMTPSLLMAELTRWGVPVEHAQTFPISAPLTTYFSVDVHTAVVFVT